MTTGKYKHILLALTIGLFAMAFAGCKKAKQIPEDQLAEIFKDMYVQNAYMDSYYHMSTDSVDVYEPLLRKHGYTTEDFLYTITEASKRKSFRMTDVVDAATEKIKAEHAIVERKIRRIDIIDSTAYAVSRKVIYTDSLITIRSMADSNAMKLILPVEDGNAKFEISYYYTLDSLDKNTGLQVKHSLRDERSNSKASSVLSLIKRERTHHTAKLTGADNVSYIEVLFGNYPEDPKRMHLTIDSLVIVREPFREEALDVLMKSYIDYRLIIDGREYYEYYNLPADSSTLHLLPPYLGPQYDSLVVE